MRRLSLYFVLSCLFFSGAKAQLSLEEAYTGLLPADQERTGPRMHRYLIDLTHENFESWPAGVEARWFSRGFNFFRYADIPFGPKSTTGLGIGLGWNSRHIFHNARFINHDPLGNTRFIPFDPGFRYRKNKLVLNYLDLGVQLRLRSRGRHNNFFIYPGFKAGYLLSGRHKLRSDSGHETIRHIRELERFRFGPTLYIGVNRFALYGFYSVSPLFKPGKGEEMHAISIGISFNLF